MKSILILTHAMELGGAEKSLLGLLEALDTTRYDVDLFLMRHAGELLPHIPDKIHLLPEIPQYASLAVPIKRVFQRGQFLVALGRYRGKKAACKRVAELGLPSDNDVGIQLSHVYTLPYMPGISAKEYDCVISYLTPHYVATERVKAKKRIAWIHTDYSTVAIDVEEQLKMWSRYDYIVSISDAVKKSFTEKFPTLSSQVINIGNMMPMLYLYTMVNAFQTEDEMPDDGTIRLLSIGRFCTAKNFDNVPDICRRLRQLGHNVKWYLIGYGGDESLIRQRISEAGMQEYVIILGKRENPYPYIRCCDLYVQPSRYEGKCVSVIEAQILQKPVIITDYPTSGSQLEDGVDGVIVPMGNEECAVGIAEVLSNPDKMNNLADNCRTRDYSNMTNIESLYKIIEA